MLMAMALCCVVVGGGDDGSGGVAGVAFFCCYFEDDRLYDDSAQLRFWILEYSRLYKHFWLNARMIIP